MTNLREELEHYRSLGRRSTEDDGPDDTGRFKAVFPMGPKGTNQEEEYISRMIARDKALNLG